MNKSTHTAVGVLLAALCGSGVGAAAQELGNPEFNAKEIRRRAGQLDALVPRWTEAMDLMGVAGLAVAVVHDDEVVFVKTLGVRDPDKGLPVTPDTMFYIASCTKSYVATGIMSLVDEGKVELDAPVKRYLPRFKLADENATQTITVRDLLSHAKGLGSDPIVLLDAYSGEITDDRYYYWLGQVKPKGAFEYTNVHYTLLGRIIEAVTGQSWKDFLAARIFEPAGMYHTTGYASRMYGGSDAALPCEFDGKRVAPASIRKTDRVMHAAGGLGTSVQDAARWIRLNLDGGVLDGKRVVLAESVHEMQKLQVMGAMPTRMPHRERQGYGLGWFIGTYHDIPMIDHGGGYVGTSTSFSFMPEYELGVAVLANGSGPIAEVVATDIYTKLLDLPTDDIMPRLKPRAKEHMARITQRKQNEKHHPVKQDGLSLPIEAYVGTYADEHWGSIVVTQKDGALSGTFGDLSLRFSTTGEDRFDVDMGTGTSRTGTFIVENGRVTALLSDDSDYGQVRFEKAISEKSPHGHQDG